MRITTLTSGFKFRWILPIILLVLTGGSARGQHQNRKKEILVLAKEDGRPIPYVHFFLHTLGTSCLFISDEKGKVFIDELIWNNSDSLTVSCLGFTKKHVLSPYVGDTIFLEQTGYDIEEVVISHVKRKQRRSKIGNAAFASFMSAQIDFESQRVLYIPLEKMKGKIVGVRYYMHDALITNFSCKPFRVRIYSEDENGGVGKDLLDKELIIMLPKGKGKWLEVDLTSFDIPLPERGVFVGLEVLPSSFYINNGYIESYTINGNRVNSLSIGVTNFRYTSLGIQTWDYSSRIGTWKQKDYYLLIQLIVAEYK